MLVLCFVLFFFISLSLPLSKINKKHILWWGEADGAVIVVLASECGEDHRGGKGKAVEDGPGKSLSW